MTVLRAFRKRPPFPIPTPSKADNLPCVPCITQRGTHPTHFAELPLFIGPQEIAVTGDNSFNTLFGREWAFLQCDDNRWFLLQWVGAEDLIAEGLTSPGWKTVPEPLLDLPGLACGTQRRLSAAFDQSARLIVAYEQAGVIYVTRWDDTLGEYVQNVEFPGHDPYVIIDAAWALAVPGSDVLLYYLPPDRDRLLCRVQRDLYAVPYELHAYGRSVVLDRVTRLFLRYQVLASDSVGVPLPFGSDRLALISDLYPYPALTEFAASGALSGAGEYRLVVLNGGDTDELSVSSALAGSGVYRSVMLDSAGDDALAVMTALTAAGEYRLVMLNGDGLDAFGVTAALTAVGEYRDVIVSGGGVDALAVGGSLTGGGTYAKA
jgi:hypothetical protein